MGPHDDNVSMQCSNDLRAVMLSCVIAPYMLAFSPENMFSKLQLTDTVLNCLFFVDIGINFFSAYYDGDYDIVDDNKVFLHDLTFRLLLKLISNHGSQLT